MQSKRFVSTKFHEEMETAVHASGLRVCLFPKKGFSKYYAIYGTEYGSLDRVFRVPGETRDTTVPDGIAHYLEHKLFEEEDGGNAFDRFALTGASSNAFTSFDMTAYLFSCTDRFYENLEILLDFVNHPWFTPENVAKEQGIIGQEIQMYEDDPEWRVFFNTLSAMFHNNPVKIDIAGTVESISHITPEILYRCYRTFYNPANMVLVLVGDISMEKAMACVDRYVQAGAGLEPVGRPKVLEPKERVRERIYQKLVVSQPLFRIGFKETLPCADPDTMLKREIATELVLEAVLGRSSDLYMELYEEGLIDSSFEAEAELAKAYGFSLIGGESKDPEQVYARVKRKLEEVQRTGILREDLVRARKTLHAEHIRVFNGVERMGNAFIRMIFAGHNPMTVDDAVDQVSEEMVMERLREHFDTGNCVLSVVEPAEPESGV